jgi:hypothetical protein
VAPQPYMMRLLYFTTWSVIATSVAFLLTRYLFESDPIIVDADYLSLTLYILAASAPSALALSAFGYVFLRNDDNHAFVEITAAALTQLTVTALSQLLGFYFGGLGTILPIIVVSLLAIYLLGQLRS